MQPPFSLRSLAGLRFTAARPGAACARYGAASVPTALALTRGRTAERSRQRRGAPVTVCSLGWSQGWSLLCRSPGLGLWSPVCSGPNQGPGLPLSPCRWFCSGSGRDLSSVTVVGSPDPLTWIRCRLIILLVKLYFEVDLASDEFHSGAKQALVQVSQLMSTGRFHRLKGLVSDEMMEYVESRSKALSSAQREQLLVNTDDIIFLLPEDIDVVFDEYGRKFCSIVMRFWFLTTLDGPEDPEATRIFRVEPRQDGRRQERVATAVYEFKRELTQGASPDWTVITVWHWHWTLAPKAPD